jgi:hypothetical protein
MTGRRRAGDAQQRTAPFGQTIGVPDGGTITVLPAGWVTTTGRSSWPHAASPNDTTTKAKRVRILVTSMSVPHEVNTRWEKIVSPTPRPRR